MKRWMSLLLVCALCLALCSCGGNTAPAEETVEAAAEMTEAPYEEPTISPEEQAAAYHEAMAAALEQETEMVVVADRAVAYVSYDGNAAKEEHDSPTYTEQYLPAEYAAETPEEVCFIIRCTHDAVVAGYYGMAGASVGTDPAYQRTLHVTVEERFTGQVLAEEKFQGGEPAESVGSGDSHYGSYPEEAEVAAWLADALKAANETRMADALAEAQGQASKYYLSRTGLIVRMTEYGYYKYSLPQAEYAADNCGADWDENAVLCLQEELAKEEGIIDSYRSYNGTIYYLQHFENFTEEQARYAADNCGADWKEQAVITAREYQTWDRQSTIFWLTMPVEDGGNGFTQEEAKYAADYYGMK